jgi:hypothetical protein
LAHLGLHKWFRQKGRPVPGFIIFDQPSQAHYPPDRDAEGSIDALPDEDQTAVLQLFKVIADAAIELAPDLQIIITDHADLKHAWFASAVVERWRGGGAFLRSTRARRHRHAPGADRGPQGDPCQHPAQEPTRSATQ